MKKVFCSLLVVLLLGACAPSQEEIQATVQASIAETQAAIPTETSIPPTETKTPSPTFTLTNTPTSTPTNTPSMTPTFTLEPATQTAISIAQTATQKSEYSTATKAVAETHVAQTAIVKSSRATGTAEAKSAYATKVASYKTVNAKELITYPDNLKGEKIVISGRIFNINNNQEFQIWIDGLSFEAVYIYMTRPFNDLYDNDRVTIYGVGMGENCGTNSYGAQVCQPLIFGDFYEKK